MTEKAFEDAITASLAGAGGYRVCKVGTSAADAGDFDAGLGLDTAELFAFIAETQPEAWAKLVALHGSEAQARKRVGDRLAAQLDERGTVDVLRHGIVDHGVELRMAYFRPAHGLTPELSARYAANRLTVTRQLPYAGAGKTLDLALFVNGLPVATAELKNPLTHQSVGHAMGQYRTDRDPANVTLGRRAVVHFAVDPDLVMMTTRLAGQATRFLPFNRGRGLGAGNPDNPAGHRTAYLWEEVWARDAWLDLLGRFVHVEPGKGSTKAVALKNGRVIFPRYHQWDAVRRIEADARANGAGQRYLVQHSAGSGKSNTIAWLAHRLMSLHGLDEKPVFDKVVVITDRVILDRQLQETIYQFEHQTGIVARIDQDSGQLVTALQGEQARIIITTIQKFPFVLEKVGSLAAERRFAIIIDEAHSSQTGEAAKDLKAVLGSAAAEAQLAAAEAADAADAPADPQDALDAAVAARGKQPNLSFFAFTATPKARTLELFGRPDVEGKVAPFHLYSMRQAIEEEFILDVLAHYMTYKTYWRVEKAVLDDPEVDVKQARKAIARFVSLHPHNLAQKAEIVIEHFRTNTRPKIGGRAKAMVVTSSRLHAVRYKLAIDKYIEAKGYADVQTLVAFSGRVTDEDAEYTESSMNKFPESQTAARFAEPEFGVLIVAEKFQTGFDQPLLHTMFVDKTLVGLAAVQTLSRLNRRHEDKIDTFVLDFRNEPEAITDAFRPWYETTVALPTDPNLLHDVASRLLGLQVLDQAEAEAIALLVSGPGGKSDWHGQVYALLGPSLARFEALQEEAQDEFRGVLDQFLRAYSFLSQIVDFGDTSLEALYLAGRALEPYVRRDRVPALDPAISLTHFRIQKTSEVHKITPSTGTGELSSIYSGKGKQADEELEHLSSIIAVLNERFGLELGDADGLFFEQLEETWASDEKLATQARVNTLENFRYPFKDQFIPSIVARDDANADLVKRLVDDPVFAAVVMEHYLQRVFERARRSIHGAE